MKARPVIYTQEVLKDTLGSTEPTLASADTPPESRVRVRWLVDLYSAFWRPLKGGDPERIVTHYGKAIELGDLASGEIRAKYSIEKRGDDVGPIGYTITHAPRPCVYAPIKEGAAEKVNIAVLKLDPRAAQVMLEIAGSANNLKKPEDGNPEWGFGKPRERNKHAEAYDPIKLYAAWMWSMWKIRGLDGEARREMLSAFGYGGTPEQFRDMMSDMGLVATKR